MPSLYEPFGLVAAECVSCGTPVAAFRTGGLRETIREGINGLLVAIGDEDGFYDAVRKLLSESWRCESQRRLIASSSAEALDWVEVHEGDGSLL